MPQESRYVAAILFLCNLAYQNLSCAVLLPKQVSRILSAKCGILLQQIRNIPFEQKNSITKLLIG